MMMAEAQLFVSQDEFTCSVCLDTLTDPVTILCGHNFCLKCLTDYWDQSQVCRCPQCRHTFTLRPELKRNNLLNEVIKKFKKRALNPPPPLPPKNYAGPGDVECDFCTGKKFRAVKSCLTCMASYCPIHLKPHYEGDAWKGHKLVDPDRNLKEKLCEKHQKSLEIFCKTDEMCVCMICVVTGHKNHEMVELGTERENKEMSVERDVEENEKSYTDLIRCIEEADRKLTERIKEQEKREMEKSERNFSSRCILPADGDLLSFTVTTDFSSEDLRKELSGLKKSLEKISQCEIMTRTPSAHEAPVFALQPPEPQSRDDFLKYFCPLTLDINTAHRYLHLSEGNKKVTREWTESKYPIHPDRFDSWPQVLCREALTGTRCYWEVECSGDFIDIGVAYKGLSRKELGWECGLGNNNKSWCLRCSHSKYSVHHNDKETVISAPYIPRIGVYLDWPAGSLSFYSVSHTMTLLHRINTSFTEPLYPGFWLSLHSSVTISHLTRCDQ
ncbi:tripartite motif-containing protein 16-like [Polypterus senegalus]|uniref:tripartite motif-containing protein 16-like n=1 Tax=Polypterus senegalus TaxID=55291 RepID=UPI00196594CA|nr:tripartite motif-containing protein 16-like [Polypterus senegalus]